MTDDHVAPWPSVYKIHYLSDTDVTFVRTSGATTRASCEPGRSRRRYRIAFKRYDDLWTPENGWKLRSATRLPGSPVEWLARIG